MAEVAGEGAVAFWSRDASDEEQPVVYIPGLCNENNLRLASKFKSAKPEDRKAGVPGPAATMERLPDWPQQRDPQEAQSEAGARSASLKDLCPEDKRRIANLIKELARVSEEKEVTEERLKSEHQSFEKKIRHLEEQNNLIATEREGKLFATKEYIEGLLLENCGHINKPGTNRKLEYRECQELLSLYQKYLSEQQDKLNRSLSDLGARSVKPRQVSRIQQQPTEGELNGSYLGQCHKASSDLESASSFAVRPFCSTDPPSKHGFYCRADRCASEIGLLRRCCGAELPDVNRGHICDGTLDNPLSHCCLRRAPHSTPGRGPPELVLTRPPDDGSYSRLSAVSGPSHVVATRVKDSAASERRKHELMLQKLELEVEKERLQQLLEQQEAKLLAKQEQLLETRPEPSRGLAAVHTREAAVGTTPSLGTFLLSNGSVASPTRGSSVGLPTPPSSKNCKKLRRPEGAQSGEKAEEVQADQELLRGTTCKGSWKNAATSPIAAGPGTEVESAKWPPGHKDALRYETSLIDMLDAISPISYKRPSRPHTKPYDLSILSPQPRSHSKPSQQPVLPGRPKLPTVDPEESRILEDIFFIC